jgi:hypothetical protein
VTGFQALWQNFANRKVTNQASFHSSNPGLFTYILVDDTGNSGHVAAATMLNQQATTCAPIAFIHDVINSPKNFIKNPKFHPLTGKIDPLPMPSGLQPIENDPTRYVKYRNVAHGSMLACDRGYISLAGQKRIVNAIKATTIYQNCVAQASKCAPGSDEDDCDPGCFELRTDVQAAEVYVHHRRNSIQSSKIDGSSDVSVSQKSLPTKLRFTEKSVLLSAVSMVVALFVITALVVFIVSYRRKTGDDQSTKPIELTPSLAAPDAADLV